MEPSKFKDGLHAAVEAIKGSVAPEVKSITAVDGNQYQFSNVPVDLVEPLKQPTAETLKIHTLTGVRDYLVNNKDDLALGKVQIYVASHAEVQVISELQGWHRQREVLVIANLNDIFGERSGKSFGQWMTQEEMAIFLQSRFAVDEVRNNVLTAISKIVLDAAVEADDENLSQRVTVKAGISMREKMNLPSPVELAPYRTFPDVDQPKSPFILRVRKSPEKLAEIALFEADGGAWKSQAIANIKNWFSANVPDVNVIA